MTDVLTGAAVPSVTTRIVHYTGGKEGFVSTVYLDAAHVLTIGYGFTMRSRVFAAYWRARHGRELRRGDTMTKAEAYPVLVALLAEEYAPAVETKLGRMALRIREAAVSAVYNLGPGALNWSWAALLLKGDLHGAAARWRKMGTTAGGRTLPGLVQRRAEEAAIAERDEWPAWVRDDDAAPDTQTTAPDIQQAQLWLNELGYACGRADGLPGGRTMAAARRFQTDHGTLKVDGIIGPATLAALQRAIDLRRKALQTAGGGAATAGAGAAENATSAGDALQTPAGGLGWLGDALLWGGIALIVLGLAWLGWRYRDELLATLKRL